MSEFVTEESLAAALAKYVRVDTLGDVLEGLGKEVRKQFEIDDDYLKRYSDAAFENIRSYVDARLEETKAMRWCGAHDPSVRSYGAQAVVQRGGALWVSLKTTGETPGSSSDWRRIATDRS